MRHAQRGRESVQYKGARCGKAIGWTFFLVRTGDEEVNVSTHEELDQFFFSFQH